MNREKGKKIALIKRKITNHIVKGLYRRCDALESGKWEVGKGRGRGRRK